MGSMAQPQKGKEPGRRGTADGLCLACSRFNRPGRADISFAGAWIERFALLVGFNFSPSVPEQQAVVSRFVVYWLFLSLYDRLSDYRWFADFIDRLFDRNANFGIWSGLFAMLVFYRLLQMLPHPAIQKAWRHLTVFAFAFCAFVLDAFSLKDWSYFGRIMFHSVGRFGACQHLRWPGSLSLAGNFVAAGNSRGCRHLCLCFLTDMLPAWEDETSALMMIALLSVAGIYAYRHNYPRLLNVSTVLIALRFLVFILRSSAPYCQPEWG